MFYLLSDKIDDDFKETFRFFCGSLNKFKTKKTV